MWYILPILSQFFALYIWAALFIQVQCIRHYVRLVLIKQTWNYEMIQRMYNLAPSAPVQRLSIVHQREQVLPQSAKNWSHLSDVVPGWVELWLTFQIWTGCWKHRRGGLWPAIITFANTLCQQHQPLIHTMLRYSRSKDSKRRIITFMFSSDQFHTLHFSLSALASSSLICGDFISGAEPKTAKSSVWEKLFTLMIEKYVLNNLVGFSLL